MSVSSASLERAFEPAGRRDDRSRLSLMLAEAWCWPLGAPRRPTCVEQPGATHRAVSERMEAEARRRKTGAEILSLSHTHHDLSPLATLVEVMTDIQLR